MKDMILKASVGIENAKNRLIDRARTAASGEQGDIVQTILIIALFVVIVVFVGGILYNAISTQATNVGDCIASANSGKCNDFKR